MSELYLFNDNGVYHPFTPTLFSKSFGGLTYDPTIVKRSSLNLTENFSKSPLIFNFQRTHTWARSLVSFLPEIPITVIVYRNSLIYWRGRITEVKANLLSISVTCDSIYTTIARSSLQPRYTLNCRHTLYSTNCGVVQSIWKVSYSVTGINSTVFTVGGLSQADGYFNAGIAEINGEKRFIIKQVGTTITISAPFTGVQTGTINLYPGCQLTEANCTTFNNISNFGGFSKIPYKNPFGSTGLL